MVDVILAFAQLSFLALGGGVAMLPEMQRLCCVVNHWVDPADFAQLYSLGQLAPGPNGIVVLLIGYRAAGAPGALAAMVSFFLPSSIIAWCVGRAWRRLGNSPWAESLRRALGPFVIGLMLAGVYSLARSSLVGPGTCVMAAVVGALVLADKLNAAILVLGGGFIGYFTL